MKIILNLISLTLYFFIGCVGNTFSSEDFDERNYVQVNVWNPSFLSSYIAVAGKVLTDTRVGHVSMEVAFKDNDRVYISYWPSCIGNNYEILSERQDEEQEAKNNGQQSGARKPKDQYYKLYSLNQKNLINYYNSSEFLASKYNLINDHQNNIHNCSSAVLRLLKKGNIEHLFEDRGYLDYFGKGVKVLTNSLVVAGTATYTGMQSGAYGGSVFGPQGTVAGGLVFGGFGLVYGIANSFGQSNKALSEINEKNDYLSELIIDPNRINYLMPIARENEKNKHPDTNGFPDLK
jgi:hypothetical protein